MLTQHITQTAEFRLATVGLAKENGLSCRLVVKLLKFGIAAQDIQDGSIGFPEKFEVWQDQGCFALRLFRISVHGTQQNGLRCGCGIQIFHSISLLFLDGCQLVSAFLC